MAGGSIVQCICGILGNSNLGWMGFKRESIKYRIQNTEYVLVGKLRLVGIVVFGHNAKMPDNSGNLTDKRYLTIVVTLSIL